MNDNTTGRIKQLERRCNELLESEAYAAGVIELLRGMVDGEAFDICEEFTEQRHSSVAPIVTVRRERDEALAVIEEVRKEAEDLESWYCTNPDAASLAGDILALIRDYRT